MSSNITRPTQLTVLKHLAGGKNVDLVSAIMKLSRYEVIDIASEYGYPDVAKMAQGVETINRDIEIADRDYLALRPLTKPDHSFPRSATRPAAVPPHSLRPAPARSATSSAGVQGAPRPPTQLDQLTAIINAGKQSKNKRVQALTDRIVDDLARLEAAIHTEQAKAKAAHRKAEQKAAAVRARTAERDALRKKRSELETELAAVKAKLRGSTSATVKTAPRSLGGAAVGGDTPGKETPAREIRTWAREVGLDVPDTGRVPQKIRAAYAEAHPSREQAA